MKFFRELPALSSRRKWQPIMSAFQMRADSDYHYVLFQAIRTGAISFFVVWCVTLYFVSASGSKGVLLFYEHLPLLWFVSGSITNSLIVPYYVGKAVKFFGFRSFDFLGAFEMGQRQQGNRQKVLRAFPCIILVLLLALQFGGIKSYLILNRYEVDTWFGYIITSFLVLGTVMSVLGAGVSHLILSVIQYKFFFSQIPNLERSLKPFDGDLP